MNDVTILLQTNKTQELTDYKRRLKPSAFTNHFLQFHLPFKEVLH